MLKVIDVTNMTRALQFPSFKNALKSLTYDGMHFARTINVIKAHMILSQLERARNSSLED